jgi:peptide/nickel transport system permease protein
MATKPVLADTGLELVAPAAVGPTRAGVGATLARFCRKKPLGAAGGVLMLLMVLAALFAEPLSTHDPIATDAANTLARPAALHWLGSDHLGRDIYSRIVHGARVSPTSAARPTSSCSASSTSSRGCRCWCWRW